MKTKYKLIADFNNADTQGRLRLPRTKLMEAVERDNIELVDGMEVIVTDEDEFEIEGTIEFSTDEHIWVAKIDWDNLKSKG